MPNDQPADDERRRKEEEALRKFCEEHPEHLKEWVDTDADFIRFDDEPDADDPRPGEAAPP